jgi:FtsZ-interacting cell division protein ZipA
MATSTIVLIVVAAIATSVLVAGLAWLARSERNRQRRAEASTTCDASKTETLLVGQQQALANGADRTAAQAHVAQSESEDWAAQVSGLQQQAAAQRVEAAIAREELVEAAIAREELSAQWDCADELDPASQSPDTPKSADHSQPQHH